MKHLAQLGKLIGLTGIALCLLWSCDDKKETKKPLPEQKKEPTETKKPSFGSGIVPIPVYPFTKPEES